MKRTTILTQFEKCGIIAVVRGDTAEEAYKASKALIDGGIKGIELTFTVPEADRLLAKLVHDYKEHPDILFGAGTVLEPITARLAIMAGAKYIVSPTFNKEIAELCNLYQIPYLPGCMTISEMQTALKAGVDVIKLFPGNSFSPTIISAFKAPMPQLSIMPTGGVNLENMENWFAQGAIAVGVGGNLLAPAKKGNFAEITQLASQYIQKYQQIKGA